MKRIVAALAALLLIVGQTFAASSITVTSANPGRNFTRYSVAWTSHTDGTVSNSFNVRAGNLVQIKFVPGSGGTQPTDLYDVTLLDADGFDVLAGAGANLSNASASMTVASSVRFVEGGALTLTIAAAGSGKTGTVVIWFN